MVPRNRSLGRFAAALLAAWALVCASVAGAAAQVGASPVARRLKASSTTHRMIIKLRNQSEARVGVMSAGRVGKINAAAREKLTQYRAMSGNAHVMNLPRRMLVSQALEVAKRLMADPDVEYAEPDVRMHALDTTPNDTLFGNQWHYKSPGTEAGGANLPAAWDHTTGDAAVVVAVVDTGIVRYSPSDNYHTDILASRIVAGYDFISEAAVGGDGDARDSDPRDPGDYLTQAEIDANLEIFEGCYPDDSGWHGTHVAGTIGARTNNTTGVAGVDWTCKILPVRVLGKCGGYTSDIADGIRWAAGITVGGVVNNNPAKVINVSIGGPGPCSSTYQNAINDAVAAGAVVLVAAGNEAAPASTSQPGNCSSVITVAAVGRTGSLASYSNSGSEVEIAAPGGDGTDYVVSLGNTGTQGPLADSYPGKQGTSMATPHVAGVAALMLAYTPTLTAADILWKLRNYARAFPGGSTCTTSICGAGIVDAHAALLAMPPGGFAVAGRGSDWVSWSWAASKGATDYKVYDGGIAGTYLNNTGGATSFTWNSRASNTEYFIKVVPVNGVGDGLSTMSPSTGTLAGAATITSVQPWITSATVNFSHLGTPSGYRIDVALNTGFTGTMRHASSSDPNAASLVVTGLDSLTGYYFRIASINQYGAENVSNYGAPTQVVTLTDILAPGVTGVSDYGSGQLRFTWTRGGNPTGLTYVAQISNTWDFSGWVDSASGVDLLTNLFTGLSPNVSYWFRVWGQASPGHAGPTSGAGPAVTYAVSPATATPAFTAVGTDRMTVSWTNNGNPAGTDYEVQLSAGPDFFTDPVTTIGPTTNWFGVFEPPTVTLSPHTVYYARVRARNSVGVYAPIAPTYKSLGSQRTNAVPVSPVFPFYSGLSATALNALFSNGSNPAQTGYVVQVSSDDFATINESKSGVMVAGTNAVAFSGLQPNRAYRFQVAAVHPDQTLTSYTQAAGTATYPTAPAASAAEPTIYLTSMTVHWTDGVNRAGTQYRVEVDDDPGFGSVNFTQDPTGADAASVMATGLAQNKVQYARVSALPQFPLNPASAPTAVGGRATLAPAPTVHPQGSFVYVTYSSMSVRWTQSAACEGYYAQLAKNPGFAGELLAQTLAGAASAATTFTGLKHSTTYYLRVAAINPEGALSYASLGSTRTALPVISSAVLNGSMSLNVVPAYAELRLIRVDIPANAFSNGTVVEVNTSVELDMPELTGGQRYMTLIGPAVGFNLSAGGLQPQRVVPITLQYDPASMPAGLDENLLSLARYDDSSRRWVALPSSVDRVNKNLTGLTDHFSFFAPVVVMPGSTVSDVEIFPNPWEPDSGDLVQGAAGLTFARLPPRAWVRIYTILGDLLDKEQAGLNGVLSWDGRNSHGRKVNAGTYLAVIEHQGAQTVRRFVVIR